MYDKLKAWGGIAIISTLTGGAIIWLYSQTVLITPVVDAVDRLTEATIAQKKKNSEEHKILVSGQHTLKSRMDKNEVKLFRVVADCTDNRNDIRNCKRMQ